MTTLRRKHKLNGNTHSNTPETTRSRRTTPCNRHCISASEIKSAAEKKFKLCKQGITYKDIAGKGPFELTDSEQHARESLQYQHKRKNLFTYKRTNPQQYFATLDQAEMAALSKEENTYSDPKGSKLVIGRCCRAVHLH